MTPGAHIAALALPEHRLAYLDYEGPVSGNRGSVKRWDAGWYEEEAYGDELSLVLAGVRVSGQARLVHVAADRWVFEWHAA